jgi:hypothetical protein
VKRLTLLALLLASSSLVAAPAPVPKPQRRAERPPARQDEAVLIWEAAVMNNVNAQQFRGRARVVVFRLVAQPPPVQAPAQPPNADPPG